MRIGQFPWSARGGPALIGEYLAIALVATVVLFHRLDVWYAWVRDESWFSMPALDLARHGRLRMPGWAGAVGADRIFLHMPPGYLIWLAGFFALFGFSEWVARAGSASLGVLATVALYAAARWTTQSRLAAGAAVVCLLSDPLFLYIAKQVRMEIMVAAGAIGSYALFLTGWPFWAGVVAGVTVVTHPNGYVLGSATLLAGWLLRWPERQAIGRSAVGFAIPVIAYGALILAHLDVYRLSQGAALATGLEAMSAGGLWANAQHEWSVRYLRALRYQADHVRLGLPPALWVALLAAGVLALPLTARRARRWVTVLPVAALALALVVIPSNLWFGYAGILLPFLYLWVAWLLAAPVEARHGPAEAPPRGSAPWAGALALAGVVLLGGLSAWERWRPTSPGEDPVGRGEMRRLAARVPDGSRVFGFGLFWRDFAERNVAYFVPEAITWDHTRAGPEAVLRRIRPEYLVLEPESLDIHHRAPYRRHLAALAICLGERVARVTRVPHFGTVSLVRVDWARDPGWGWPRVEPLPSERVALPLAAVAARSGARIERVAGGLRFVAPRSIWDSILSWELPAARLEPGTYELEVAARLLLGEVELNVHDEDERQRLARRILTAPQQTTARLPFDLVRRPPGSLKVVLWNHAASTPGGAAAEGVLEAIALARVEHRCRITD